MRLGRNSGSIVAMASRYRASVEHSSAVKSRQRMPSKSYAQPAPWPAFAPVPFEVVRARIRPREEVDSVRGLGAAVDDGPGDPRVREGRACDREARCHLFATRGGVVDKEDVPGRCRRPPFEPDTVPQVGDARLPRDGHERDVEVVREQRPRAGGRIGGSRRQGRYPAAGSP